MDYIVANAGLLAFNLGKALLFLIAGWWFASWLARMIRDRLVAHPRIDDTLGYFVSSVLYYLVLGAVIIAILQLFGFQVTSLVAVLGAASLAIGLALQGTLSNVAAGVMVVFFRPYKLGDEVEIAGVSGRVKDINLFSTEIDTPDNVRVIVPNGQAWGTVIRNASYHDIKRFGLTLSIGQDTEPGKVLDLIRQIADAESLVLTSPAPSLKIIGVSKAAFEVEVSVWAKNGDTADAKSAIMRAVKREFLAKNIGMA